jgi:hypothetical protein
LVHWFDIVIFKTQKPVLVKRSSKRDLNQLAAFIVEQVTEENRENWKMMPAQTKQAAVELGRLGVLKEGKGES